MKLNFIIVFLTLCLGFTAKQEQVQSSSTKLILEEKAKVPFVADTLKAFPFKDSSRYVQLIVFSDLEQDQPNTYLTLNKGEKTLIIDSLISMFPHIELRDFNYDNIKDISIIHTSGARANITNHLFTVNHSEPYLQKVLNFETIVNPKPDKTFNVISSTILTSRACYSFHRVSGSRLFSLDTTFCERPDSIVWKVNTLESMSKILDDRQKVISGG